MQGVAWALRTFTSETGAKPFEEWVRTLDSEALEEVAYVSHRLRQEGIALGMPHARPLGDGLWELRVRDSHGIYRVIYFHWFGRTFGLLHGFTKKSRATPKAEIAIARSRRAAWLARPGPSP